MRCTLDTIKNNQWMAGSLAAAGLTAAGTIAHRLGLFALCPKGVSDACGYIAAVVSRHRFASVAIVLAAVGVVTLCIVTSVRSSNVRSVQPFRTDYQRLPSEPIELARCRQVNLFDAEQNKIEESVRDLVSQQPLPDALRDMMSKKRFNLSLDDQTLEQLISNVLVDFLNGGTPQFYHFFEPSYLTVAESEGDKEDDGKRLSLQSQRVGEYAELMSAIICHYHQLIGKEVLHCDWIGGCCEVLVGSEVVKSTHRSPYIRR